MCAASKQRRKKITVDMVTFSVGTFNIYEKNSTMCRGKKTEKKFQHKLNTDLNRV